MDTPTKGTGLTHSHQEPRAGWPHVSASLGAYQPAVDLGLTRMEAEDVLRRIWAHDHTLWKDDPTEITNRLGWLDIAEPMREHLDSIQSLASDLRNEGYANALLLGMGGSSLAPEVFRKTFGVGDGCLDLAVLDSTDPDAILAPAETLDLSRTLFIVSTKSGGTVETLSFFKFFYDQMADAVGRERAGAHFVAITDPGSKLADIAEAYAFRATFLNDPNIGGRYSALSYFGLVPAALVGVDLEELLRRMLATVCNCQGCDCTAGGNSAAILGTVMGVLAQSGRDKLTLVASPALSSFGDWLEQLVAESTGKDGQGILPVVGEPLGAPQVYGTDRLFVHLRLAGYTADDAALQALQDAGHPVVRVELEDLYDLGGQFFLWELATAVASYHLGINPFDQPNVEAAKVLARKMVAEYGETGVLPGVASAPPTAETLARFVAQAAPGDYVALQAWTEPGPEVDAALAALRVALRDRYHLATTVGYGPRFLHSTGQLHKGDRGNGLFVQFTSDDPRDVPIPDEAGEPRSSISFAVLKTAQALGDRQALLDAGRRVIRLHLDDAAGGLRRLAEGLA